MVSLMDPFCPLAPVWKRHENLQIINLVECHLVISNFYLELVDPALVEDGDHLHDVGRVDCSDSQVEPFFNTGGALTVNSLRAIYSIHPSIHYPTFCSEANIIFICMIALLLQSS